MLIAEQGTGVRTVTAGNIRRGGELVSDRSGSGRNRWLRAGTTASLIYFMANKANGRVHVLEAGAARPRQFRTGELTGLTPVILAPLVGQLPAAAAPTFGGSKRNLKLPSGSLRCWV